MRSFIRPLSLAAFLLAAFVASTPVLAKKVGKTEVPDTLEVAGQSLVLNGAGRRTKSIIKVYIASLYLGKASSDAEAIIAADEPMAIQITVLSRFLNRAKMKQALVDGFERATGGNTAPIQSGIDELLELMNFKLKKKDNYLFAYDPAGGTILSRNGEVAGSIEGLEFKKALFGIWLAEPPAQKSLKKKMLGG